MKAACGLIAAFMQMERIMLKVQRGLAAAIATALLSVSPIPAAQAYQGDTGHKQTHSNPATSNPSDSRGTRSWPDGAPDYNGGGVG